MTEQVFEGVHMDLTPYRQLTFDYEPSDVRVAYRRTDPKSWDDLINWLEKQGSYDNEFTPGEVVAMVEDLRMLKSKKASFIDNPDKAFQEAHGFRIEDNKKYAKDHQEIIQAAARSSS